MYMLKDKCVMSQVKRGMQRTPQGIISQIRSRKCA